MKKSHIGLLAMAAIIFTGCSAGTSEGKSADTVYTINTPLEAASALQNIQSLGGILNNPSLPAIPEVPDLNLSLSSARTHLSPMLAPLSDSVQCQHGSITVTGDDSLSSGNIDFGMTFSKCEIDALGYIDGSLAVKGYISESFSEADIDINQLTLSTDAFYVYVDMDAYAKMDVNNNSTDLYISVKGTSIAEIKNPYARTESTIHSFELSTVDNKTTLNGKTSISSTIEPCHNGTYEFQTLSPLEMNGTTITSGSMQINSVTYEFLSEDVVKVTYESGRKATVTLSDYNTTTCH